MRRIEVDEDVWRALQENAEPLIDSPNAVLRRLLELDVAHQEAQSRAMIAIPNGWHSREPRHHNLTSAKHALGKQEIWWYGIPPLGKKYQPHDRVTFRLRNFHGKKDGEAAIELDGHYLDRLDRAAKDKKGYTHVKIVRDMDNKRTTIHFGRKEGGAQSDDIAVILV